MNPYSRNIEKSNIQDSGDQGGSDAECDSTSENEEHKHIQSQLESNSSSHALRRKRESAVEREQRLVYMRQRAKIRRSEENTEQTQSRLESQRARTATRIVHENLEQRQSRLESQRARTATRIVHENLEQRQSRLESQRARTATRIVHENLEQRQSRLESQRARTATRIVHENLEQRQSRLESQRARTATRIVHENLEQRQSRLESVRVRASNTLANENTEEKQARHHSMSLRSSSRRISESSEERRERLTQDRNRHIESRQNELDSLRRNRLERERHRRMHLNVGAAAMGATSEEHYIGQMDVSCVNCGALHFPGEPNTHGSFYMCCNHGSVIINPFTNYPVELKNLLTEQTTVSKDFRKLVRNYNSALAMASMGAQLDVPKGRGPYCFRIHDQVYHFIGPLHPQKGKKPIYGQIYILDTDSALNERMKNLANVDCNRQIMHQLGTYLLEHNHYAKSFKMMKDVFEKEKRDAKREKRTAEPVKMIFDINEHLDRRRFNAPVTSEVAVVFVGEDESTLTKRSYAVHSLGGGLKNIREIDPECDPLIYPIIFPNGEPGWHTEMRKPNGKRISQMDYYSSMIQERKTFNPLFYCGKLFQQFLVDSFMKIEQNRLNYARTHQKELRADSYNALRTYLTDDRQEGPPGKQIILPSTFKSGPRGMQQSYRDAMAIVARFGKPDYFLTITCNPKWQEIQEQLKEGQSASDRPDIVARVFHLKLQELFDDLFKKNVLGEVAAYVSVIEFQKRGLPHSHNLLIMKSAFKPRTAEIVDCYVSAEIPDSSENPRLYEIVKSMIHKPCGVANPNAPCMIKNKCSKHFPKPFQETTTLEGDSYPKYMRRNNGRKISIGEESVDNQWIVPFNSYLSLKFNCHINLEVCALIAAVMYLYKYIYKGPDQAALKLTQASGEAPTSSDSHDEIRAYLKTRYLCAPEAAHRIFGYDMQKRSHSVEILAVHLENEETVTFTPGEVAAIISEHCPSTLMAYFKTNAESEAKYGQQVTENNDDSRQYTYLEMPEYFTFSKHRWSPRKKASFTIGRMHSVNPKEQERFSLRMLLLNRKAVKSFSDMRTVNDIVYDSYAETAKELDLLHDDSYFYRCIEEASLLETPRELRSLFAMIIIFSDVMNPQEIWTEFEKSFSADYVYHGHSDLDASALAYYDILDRTATQGVDLKLRIIPPQIARPSENVDHTNYAECKALGDDMYTTLNQAQKVVVDNVLEAFEENKQRLLYLDGPGGSGKTYVYNTLYNILTAQHIKVISVAWTGIAANLLPFGRTASSTFRLPINNEMKTSSMKRQSTEAIHMKAVRAIFWDEAPMAPKEALEAVDLLLKDIMMNNLPFGGKTVILGGDFRQILPVVEHGGEEECVNACIKNAHLWPLFEIFSLTHNMRLTTGNNEWSKYLLKVGNDEEEKDDAWRIRIPDSILLQKHESLIDYVFGDALGQDSTDLLINRAILMPKNVEALNANLEVLEKMQGEEKIYRSIDEAILDETLEQENPYEQEFLNKLTPTGFPPHELHLKKGAVVMLLRNLDVEAGMCNGTRLIITEMGHRVLRCKIATGSRKGDFVFVPRIDNYSDKNLPFRFKRRQFPIRLSFAMTINKSQGQTFERIGLCLKEEVFAHGQLYVALSRVRSKDGIKIECADNQKTRNVVYKNVIE